MSIAHGAPYASGAVPIPISEPIGEGFTHTGEGIGDTLARLADRLAVVAVSAHIMERRHPSDVYARSIARESRALAVELRELTRQTQTGAPMRAPRIVDATPDAVSSTDGEPDATPASPSPTGATAQKRRQTPPEARHAAPAGGSSERPPATPKPSLASSGAKGGAQ